MASYTVDKPSHATICLKCEVQRRFFPVCLCPAGPEKEDQRAAGSPAALTQLALCLRLAPDLKGWQRAVTLNDS